MIKLQVAGLSLDPVSKSPILVLCTNNNSHILPIWVGSSEAVSISLALQSSEAPRPLTHDLFLSMVKAVGYSLDSVQILRVDEGIFYASVELKNGSVTHKLDSRPSDAVALALRAGAPIFTTQMVIDEVGFKFPEGDDNPAVPVTAGDGAIMVLSDDQNVLGLEHFGQPDTSFEKKVADLLAAMDPESKYKM